jgi:bifunctional DNase/RNase
MRPQFARPPGRASARGRARARGAAAALAAALLATLAACRHGAAPEVQVDVRNVGFDHQAGSPVVILQARDGGRALPIWIGPAEAQAIAMELQKVAAPRPLTHDLIKHILDRAGVALRRVRITDVEHETFFATLVLDQGGREMEVDSRPSDAIALALRFACPILVDAALMASGAAVDLGGEHEAAQKIWGMTVQDLTPALADSLGCDATAGVVVSDVDGGRAGDDVPRRGDVIVAVDDTPVASVAALRALVGDTRATRRLELRRGSARLSLAFAPRG